MKWGRISLALRWHNLTSSLGFVPAVFVFLVGLLALALLAVDRHLIQQTGEARWWLFSGSAEGAQSLLSVVAGSLITVIAVAFSVTIIAIQQASTQYTPRILRNFTSDRGNQWVLGIYLATFTFALLVLREVRQAIGTQVEFVPALSVFSAIVLALISLASLIYFIHHISELLQVSRLLSVIRGDLEREIDRQFPCSLGKDAEEKNSDLHQFIERQKDADRHEQIIRVKWSGHLRKIKEESLISAMRGKNVFAVIPMQIGEFVNHNSILLRLWSDHPIDKEDKHRMMEAFDFADQRSIEQDPMFGMRQLVDIAVKALSPGINDPTTAEQAIDQISEVLLKLLERDFPSPLRILNGDIELWFKTPSFGDYVETGLTQIRHAAKSDPHVTKHLLHRLAHLAEHVRHDEHGVALQQQLEDILEILPRCGFPQRMEWELRVSAEQSLRSLKYFESLQLS